MPSPETQNLSDFFFVWRLARYSPRLHVPRLAGQTRPSGQTRLAGYRAPPFTLPHIAPARGSNSPRFQVTGQNLADTHNAPRAILHNR